MGPGRTRCFACTWRLSEVDVDPPKVRFDQGVLSQRERATPIENGPKPWPARRLAGEGPAGARKTSSSVPKRSGRQAKHGRCRARRLVQAQLQAAEESHLPIPLVRYGHFPLRRIWTKDLQLDVKIRNLQAKSAQRFDRNAALSFMTFMKVLDPHSILFSYSSKDSFIGDPAADLSLDNLYSTLDFMQSSKNELFGWINRRLDEQFGKSARRSSSTTSRTPTSRRR